VRTYHGDLRAREDLRDQLRGAYGRGRGPDVLLTTYSYFERESGREDRHFLEQVEFNYLVLDEAHCLRNSSSSRYLNLTRLRAAHRLLLSGTPLQNDFRELISLLCFLNPSIFRAKDRELLEEHFKALSGDAAEEHTRQLRDLFAPFVLRRLKSDVLDQLTEKVEQVELLDLPRAQRDVYDSIIAKHLEAKRRGLGARAWSATEAKNAFTELRKAANHPLLLRRHYADEAKMETIARALERAAHFGAAATGEMVRRELRTWSDLDLHHACVDYPSLGHLELDADTLFESVKMQRLRELLPRLAAEGHRMLIFSQWTRLLDLLEILCGALDMAFLRLDGSTSVRERQELIDTFTTSDIPVFLLSTRAGGLGINLTAADTVILHDPDFNPENDRQAEDRCHRIGQTKPVRIIRLVTRDTVDNDIFDMGQRKSKLSRAVLNEDGRTSQESSEEGGTPGAPSAKSISVLLDKAVAAYLERSSAAAADAVRRRGPRV